VVTDTDLPGHHHPVADGRLGTLLKSQKGDAARPEDLQQQVSTVVRVLLAAVEKP
jgi:hypothetical protein